MRRRGGGLGRRMVAADGKRMPTPVKLQDESGNHGKCDEDGADYQHGSRPGGRSLLLRVRSGFLWRGRRGFFRSVRLGGKRLSVETSLDAIECVPAPGIVAETLLRDFGEGLRKRFRDDGILIGCGVPGGRVLGERFDEGDAERPDVRSGGDGLCSAFRGVVDG